MSRPFSKWMFSLKPRLQIQGFSGSRSMIPTPPRLAQYTAQQSGLGRILLPPTSPPTSPATSSPPSPPSLALIASPSRWIEVLQICKSVWLPKKPSKLEECHKFCETRPHTKLLRDKSRSFSLGGTITGGSFDLCMQEHWRGGSKVLNHRNLNAATIINEQERRKSPHMLVARSVSFSLVQE